MADDQSDDTWDSTPPFGRPKAPEPSSTLAVMDRRMRSTDARALETLDRVGSLRVELLAHLRAQDGSIAGMESKIDLLLRIFAAREREESQIRVSATKAAIDIHRTGEIALIDETAERAKYRRAMALKVIAIVGPAIAAIVGAIIAGGCP